MVNFKELFQGFFNSEKVGGLLLVLCTVVSLLIANGSGGDAYAHLMHDRLGPSSAGLNLSIEQWINDGLMAVFF
ncbi:MAG: Na(+)/H(+) antiporter NhaA, partial [Sphingobacteriales bacterium]